MTELAEMPVNAFGPPTPGGELEGQCRDFMAISDEVNPVSVVALGARIDMQGGRQPCIRSFGPDQGDPLDGVQVVSSRHIGQDTVIGCGEQPNIKQAKILQYFPSIGELPPALDETILVDATKHNRCVTRNMKAISKLIS